MEKHKELFRIKYEFIKRTRHYKAIAEILCFANCHGLHPTLAMSALFQRVNDVERDKVVQFYFQNIHCFDGIDKSFDDIWNDISSATALFYNSDKESSVLNTANEIDAFLRSQIDFCMAFGRMPTYVELYKAFKQSPFCDRGQYINISIPLNCSAERRDLILEELDKIASAIKGRAWRRNSSKRMAERLGIFGRPRIDELKRCLGVYILKQEMGYSRSQIANSDFNVADEYAQIVYDSYKISNVRDKKQSVKDDYDKAKAVIVHTENGEFPFGRDQDIGSPTRLFNSITPRMPTAKLFSPVDRLSHRRFHLRKRRGEKTI